MSTVHIRFGDEELAIEIPARNLLQEVGMAETIPAADWQGVLRAALDAPVDTPPLQQLAAGKQRVVILVDDITRPTPTHLLLPAILERLEEASVRDDAITILVATGTHRPMTPAELEQKVGAPVMTRYRVINHDYKGEGVLVDLGETPSGVPITMNRLVAEADFVIGVGNIVPHRYCGWAGGAKIIQPGISGEATTAATHLMITKDPGARLGVVENRVRHEIEAVADTIQLRFIVNTILDRYANIVDIVAGDFRAAFRKGVAAATEVYSARLRGQADIVLASAYPSDINFWQAGKALYAADLVVREGGIIILASPCYEGVGEHDEFVELLQYDYQGIEARLDADTVHDRIGAAASLAVALVAERAEIWLAGANITDEQAARMRARRFANVQQAVDAALAARGDDASVIVLHEATELLPIVMHNAQ